MRLLRRCAPRNDPSLDFLRVHQLCGTKLLASGAAPKEKDSLFFEYTSPFFPFQHKPFCPFRGISSGGALKNFNKNCLIVHFSPHMFLNMSKKKLPGDHHKVPRQYKEKIFSVPEQTKNPA
jgi:hypothetical protein